MKIELPAIFSDGMVIGKNAKIWGWAQANKPISAEFCGKKYETLADRTGRFEFTVKSKNFGGPHNLTVADKTISDVYVGHVWLCAGQSNMEAPLARSRPNLGEYVLDDPQIRMFQAEKGLSFGRVRRNVNGEWRTACGEALNQMFAVPYFFARNIAQRTGNVPIGLVCVAAGGTSIEGFLPEKIISEYPEAAEMLASVKTPGTVENATSDGDKAVRDWHATLDAKDLGLTENWASPAYDDSLWESRALLDFTNYPSHGSVWLRKKFVLPENPGKYTRATDKFTLNFGRVEDSVTVYINGEKVTNVGYMYPPCRCDIPASFLREGENTVAVRVIGDVHNPRIVPGKEYALIHPGGRIDLTVEKWKYCVGAEVAACVPSPWFFSHPCGVYNFMLAPLLGYSVEGLIWYQGESNTNRPHSYKTLFSRFVSHIRENFGKIPVIYTQLANYIDPHSYDTVGGFGAPGGYWAVLREQQRQCLSIPNTAMAVTIDCGEYNDLHPWDKKTVGDRLALHARRMVYGEDIVSDGPAVAKVVYIPEDKKIVVHFANGESLWVKDGHPTIMVLYTDGTIHNLYAAICGNTLAAPVGTKEPRAIRFGWADCPVTPLYNAYGLPASPFEEVIKK